MQEKERHIGSTRQIEQKQANVNNQNNNTLEIGNSIDITNIINPNEKPSEITKNNPNENKTIKSKVKKQKEDDVKKHTSTQKEEENLRKFIKNEIKDGIFHAKQQVEKLSSNPLKNAYKLSYYIEAMRKMKHLLHELIYKTLESLRDIFKKIKNSGLKSVI